MKTRTKIAIAGALVMGAFALFGLVNTASLVIVEMSQQTASKDAPTTTVPDRRDPPPRRALATLPVPTDEITPVHYRAKPLLSAEHEDFRRNLWEELQSFAEEADLSTDQRARFLDDLADIAETLRAEWDRDLELGVQSRSAAETRSDNEEILAERMQYMSDEQWDLFTKRFKRYGYLPMDLMTQEVLERDVVAQR